MGLASHESSSDPLTDAIALVHLNLEQHPNSTLSQIALARLYDYAGDSEAAAKAARRALDAEISNDEREEMLVVLDKIDHNS